MTASYDVRKAFRIPEESCGYPLFQSVSDEHDNPAKVQDIHTVNFSTDEGHTALHLATASGKVKIVTFLLRSGARVDSTDKNGWNAMHWAAHVGNDAVIPTLKKFGVAISQPNKAKLSPLHIAIQENRPTTVETLVLNGAKVDSTALELIKNAGTDAKIIRLITEKSVSH
jgi:ankyrin